MLPAYAPLAPAAAAIESIGKTAEQAALTYTHQQAEASAVRLSAGYAMEMDQKRQAIMTAPPHTREEGSAELLDANGQPTGEYDITKIIPKSETMYSDLAEAEKAIRAKWMAGADAPTQQIMLTHPFRSLDHLMVPQMREMALAARQSFISEQIGTAQDVSSMARRSLASQPISMPPFDDDGHPVLDPADDRGYQGAKKMVQESVDALKASGVPAAHVEAFREKALNDLAHSRASQYADQQSSAWLVSKEAGTNSWDKELKDPEQMRALSNQADAAGTRAYNRVRQAHADEVKATYSAITDKVLLPPEKGGYRSEDEIRATPGWAALTGTEKKEVIDMFRKPVSAASDPAVRSAVSARVYQDSPTISTNEIQQIPGLSNEDRITFSKEVMARKDYWRGQEKSDVERRHTESVRIGHEALSTTGSIAEKLDPKSQDYKAIFDTQMSQRSSGAGAPIPGYPRKENPEDVEQAILPGLLEKMKEDTRGEYDTLSRIVQMQKYPTKDALKAVPPAQRDASYYEQAKRLQDLDSAKENYDRMQKEIERRRALKKAQH